MRRAGAFNVTLESWHIDIFDFIDLRKKNGEDRRRCQDLFLTISMPDLFIERIKANSTWTLFDPHDCPELTELYGDEFKAKYEEYEAKFTQDPSKFNPYTRTIPVVELTVKILESYIKEGMPFIFFKDTVNKEHKYSKELGIIRHPNLCMEVFQPDDANSTFVCNLAALNLARLTDKENLIATSKLAIRALDNIIDVTTYSSDRAATRQKLTRSTGLGAVGEAERLATLNIYYGSKEHEQWLHDTYGTIRKSVDEATVELAKEKGGNEIDPSVRNLYRLAIAPNTASGLLAGTTASCEPIFDRLYVENSKVGTYKMVAPNIDINNVSHYRTAYEYDQADLIRMTGIRQKYIDMGISHSLYIDPTAEYKGKPFTPIALLKLILLAHKEGVKTLYYFRAKARKNSDTVAKGDTTVCENCAN